jgi:hypothetical protein
VTATPEIRYETATPVTEERVLRAWVRREARKSAYPGADPTDWDRDRLLTALSETYDEPAATAVEEASTWTALRLSGSAVGDLAPFPGSGWTALADDGRIAAAVDRLQSEDLAAEFPDATASIDWFRTALPEREFGGLVALARAGEWPPILLEGNHRACAANWLAREAETEAEDEDDRSDPLTLTVHLAHGRPLAALPLAER